MSLRLVPVRFADAAAFVAAWHRHNRPPLSHIFSIGAAVDETLVGVAIVGRPVARTVDNGTTLEVTRVATDGTQNANSFLYAAAWRATRALGYGRLITYTLPTESGSSLRAAGFRIIGQTRPREGWSRPARPRADTGYAMVPRTVWEAPSTLLDLLDREDLRP